MDSRVLALLGQARAALDRQTETGLEHALLFAVEAALSLAEACEAEGCGDRHRVDRTREAYSCVRAAAMATRFAIVEAEDSRPNARG